MTAQSMFWALELEPAACVPRGARWLDTRIPDWAARVNTQTLDFGGSFANDVIGQLFAGSPDLELVREQMPHGTSFVVTAFGYRMAHVKRDMSGLELQAVAHLVKENSDGPYWRRHPDELLACAVGHVYGFDRIATASPQSQLGYLWLREIAKRLGE